MLKLFQKYAPAISILLLAALVIALFLHPPSARLLSIIIIVFGIGTAILFTVHANWQKHKENELTRPEFIRNSIIDLLGLALVMGAAVTLTMLSYRLIFRRERPLLGERFMVPTRRDIDPRLVGGAVLFGAGWGLTGLCPGPALSSLVVGDPGVYVFLGTMVVGMLLYTGWDRARQAAQERQERRSDVSENPVLEGGGR